ncbi:MAG: tRNA pseudouridine(55) synthase TruB [Candidatus Gastranaerophilales bacterium]|nr:tRNA pseudouridine(55) synthase TruB [Candidatus Gastranaerophilales bacterium]
MFGFINVNKPSGISSHKVISILRKITGIKQIGHAGTLDPLASGVLPIAIGKAAKLIDFLPENKRYTAGMYFGKVSDTYDTTGTITDVTTKKITLKEIKNITAKYKGKICQIPPAYSAVHYNGKRLYELARQGKVPDDIPSREITVYKNDILDFDYENQILKLDITCSKGTYIRTIVNDIGSESGYGAIMFELIRTESSGMKIENSLSLSENTTINDIEKALINPLDLLQMTNIQIDNAEYKLLANGRSFKRNIEEGYVLLTQNKRILALAYARTGIITPKKVFI